MTVYTFLIPVNLSRRLNMTTHTLKRKNQNFNPTNRFQTQTRPAMNTYVRTRAYGEKLINPYTFYTSGMAKSRNWATGENVGEARDYRVANLSLVYTYVCMHAYVCGTVGSIWPRQGFAAERARGNEGSGSRPDRGPPHSEDSQVSQLRLMRSTALGRRLRGQTPYTCSDYGVAVSRSRYVRGSKLVRNTYDCG